MNNNSIACLLLLESGVQVPDEIFTNEIKDEFLHYHLAALNRSGWYITEQGIDYLEKEFRTKHARQNYNEQINSMSDAAVNAWVCATINSPKGFYSRLGVNETRTLMQHLYTTRIERRMGPTLVEKWHRRLTESLKYFNDKRT